MKIFPCLAMLCKCLLTILVFGFGVIPATAQDFNVRLSGREATYDEIFTEIEKQGQIWFAVINDEFDLRKRVSVPEGEKPLGQVLDGLLAGTGQTYRLEGKHILVYPAERPAPQIVEPLPDGRIRSSIKGGVTGNAFGPQDRWILVSEGRDSTYKVIEYRPLSDDFRFSSVGTGKALPLAEQLPKWAGKINLLYGAAALTPNLAFEAGLGRRTTIELSGAYNPWKLDSDDEANKKMVHFYVRPEFRYWLCERFNGHFFGVHAFGGGYNVGGRKIPMLFDKEYRYEGWGAGAGITYGYHWVWNKRWGMEFNIGVGYAYLDYDRYDCIRCTRASESMTKNYFGPTRAGITLTYIIK